MLMLVAHELQSGAALPPEVGAMYGDGNTSEAKLAHQLAMLRFLSIRIRTVSRRNTGCQDDYGQDDESQF